MSTRLKYLLCKWFGHKPKVYNVSLCYYTNKPIEVIRRVIWCERCGVPEIDIIMDKMK